MTPIPVNPYAGNKLKPTNLSIAAVAAAKGLICNNTVHIPFMVHRWYQLYAGYDLVRNMAHPKQALLYNKPVKKCTISLAFGFCTFIH